MSFCIVIVRLTVYYMGWESGNDTAFNELEIFINLL